MAKIALAVGGAVAGGIVGGFLGGPLGAIEGVSVGLSIGGAIGMAAFPHQTRRILPMQDLQVSSSADGAPIPFGYASNRYAGQIIWAPQITFVREQESAGGGSGGPTSSVYIYYADFAVAFGEGPGTIRRIWGDSKVIWQAPRGIPGNYIPLGSVPVWDPTVAYNVDDMIVYPSYTDVNGLIYQCLLPNTDVTPVGNSLYWEVTSSYPPWQSGVIYQPGATVDYWGQIYAANHVNPGGSPAGNPNWTPLAEYYAPPTIYPGDELQLPDPNIQGAEGAAITPAFRGLIYAVWEQFPLANFGNRIPNLRAEIYFPDPGIS
jgi:hypothetical protein